jgi:hypothetical protein
LLERWIKTSEGWIALKPVPLERLPSLEGLLALVRALDSEEQAVAAQKVLNLHERLDAPGLYGLRLELIADFGEVFGVGGYIERTNAIKPPPSDDEADPHPPWTSGDYTDDWLADLIYSLGDYRQAHAFVAQNSLQTTMNVLHRLRDLQKGPKGREEEANKKWYWSNVSQFMNFETGDFEDV